MTVWSKLNGKMKKECTEEQALLKAEAYCSMAERCKEDVYCKLKQWGVSVTSFDVIVAHLEKERFLDERRYSVAFVRDKYCFAQWGRVKIAQMLKMKRIAANEVASAMNEIDEDEYLSILRSLLQKKKESIKAKNEYERNGKLIRFALGKGYEMEEVLECMKQIGHENECLG